MVSAVQVRGRRHPGNARDVAIQERRPIGDRRRVSNGARRACPLHDRCPLAEVVGGAAVDDLLGRLHVTMVVRAATVHGLI